MAEELRCCSKKKGNGSAVPLFKAFERALIFVFHRIDHRVKRFRVVHGQVSQHLSVERHLALGQLVHQLGVGDAILAGGSIDTGDPKAAKRAFFGFAVTVGVLERLFNGIFGNGIDVLASAEVTLCQF